MLINIDLLINNDIEFALYRLPNQQEPILVIGKQNETKLLTSISELTNVQGFILAPFKPSEKTPIVCIKPDCIIEGAKNIINYLKTITLEANHNNRIDDDNVKYENYYPSYKAAFDKFIEVLLTRQFQKLVLSRPFHYKNESGISPASVLEKALNSYPTSFVYICYTKQSGIWFGCSPELLLTGQGDNWKTVSLAGTQSIENTPRSYNWDNKNRYEQQLVSDYIRHLMETLNLQYHQNDSQTIKVGNLIHLKTSFTFKLNNTIEIGELLNRLHPTPAICGLPKEKAYNYIIDNERYDRSYYSGFIGYLNKEGKTDLYVNLRCMKINTNNFLLYAGGGLLPTSELSSEWDETNAKLETMLSLIKSN